MCKYVEDGGQICGRAVLPKEEGALSEEDLGMLKTMPGVWEAHQGLTALQEKLKVCTVSGSKVIVAPTSITKFQAAPPHIRDEVNRLVRQHEDDCADLLKTLLSGQTSTNPDDAEVQDPEPAPAPDLLQYDSLESLKSSVTIVGSCEAAERSVQLLADDKGSLYALAVKENTCIKKHTKLGSVGSGKFLPRDEAISSVVEFNLDNDKALVSYNEKISTLYTVAKKLMAESGAQEISLVGYGKLTLHDKGFSFEHARNAPGHEAHEYQIREPGPYLRQAIHVCKFGGSVFTSCEDSFLLAVYTCSQVHS